MLPSFPLGLIHPTHLVALATDLFFSLIWIELKMIEQLSLQLNLLH